MTHCVGYPCQRHLAVILSANDRGTFRLFKKKQHAIRLRHRQHTSKTVGDANFKLRQFSLTFTRCPYVCWGVECLEAPELPAEYCPKEIYLPRAVFIARIYGSSRVEQSRWQRLFGTASTSRISTSLSMTSAELVQ